MESAPRYLPLHHYFLLGFLKNSLNGSTVFRMFFLCCHLLGFCSVKHQSLVHDALSGALKKSQISLFSSSRAVRTSSPSNGVISKRNIKVALWCQLILDVMIIYLKRNMRTIQRKKKGRAVILSRYRCLISDIWTIGLEVG